ncbi:MAG: hypothetical protein A2X28_04945 [Elusimicrobia bacterium GWA2_56_46]|nr:MAG: hypothetical protein A2X28_04945 [Elusimicrobia bacterium GWA2_56_46]OGR56219.1 MAG: hypothetical protein A2X39_08365 [Elusimicrobia bacterium GWC2_56_31]HBB66953.1 hypothetical protein [Elusimicrobiota bacterium]HBW23004.1 hypothetical protein [Elusimicrobiota bacterium]
MKRAVLIIAGLAASLSAVFQDAGAGEVRASADKAFGGLDPSSMDMRFQAPAAPARAGRTASSAEMDQWNGYLARGFGGVKAAVSTAMYKGVSAPGAVVERVELEKILDANLKTKLTFQTASGDTVHVSGALAANCDSGGTSCGENDRYFLIFRTSRGQTVFVKGRAAFLGSREILFDGDGGKYLVSISMLRRRLTVETAGRVVLDVSLDELVVALREKGKRLESGARHNFYYNTEILQDSAGNGRFGKGRVLTFAPRGDAPNQTVSASRISPEGVVIENVEPHLGFRIVNGILEIYQF